MTLFNFNYFEQKNGKRLNVTVYTDYSAYNVHY